MMKLQGFQKRYLRGLAHDLKPIVLIGKEGIQDGAVRAIDAGLSQHELIKIKFNEFKEKSQKEELTEQLIQKTGSTLIGMIGHTAILFRPQMEPEKQRIQLPVRGK